jgi:outer membrane protein assembly factor BamE
MILRTTLISLIRQFSRPMRKLHLNQSIVAICCIVGISACAEWLPEAHRLDLQEGNTIKLEQLESLEIGMTKDDVRKIMGSPMLSDPFHEQRWDYIYRYIPDKGFIRKSLLTLYFEDDKLVRIDDSKYIEP